MISVRKTILSLLGLVFIDQLYLSLTTPLLTLIFFDPSSRLFGPETTLATRSLWFGLCVAMPNAINMFFAPILSMLSDELGRRKIFAIEIFSAFLFSFAVGAGIYLAKLPLIFLGFMVKGAFARTNPTALTIIGDTAPPNKKLVFMGYLQLAISIGAAIGPILGGLIASRYFFSSLNYSFAFFMAAALALLNTFLSCRFLPETLRKAPSNNYLPSWKSIRNVMMHPKVLKISITLLLIQLSWSMYYQFMPPILKTNYSFNNHQLGLFIGMIAVWLAIATSVGVRWLDHFFEMRKILFISMFLVLFGLLITLLASTQLLPVSVHWIWIGAIPIAAGDVISYSCLTSLYSDAVAHEDQGKVMGISFIIVALAWTITGISGGYLMSLNAVMPLLVAPLGILTALFYTTGHRLVELPASTL